jgi:hypothetical protein
MILQTSNLSLLFLVLNLVIFCVCRYACFNQRARYHCIAIRMRCWLVDVLFLSKWPKAVEYEAAP